MGDYLVALASGAHDPKAAKELYATVAQLTGLDEATVARWHGRIPVGAYIKDMTGHDGRVLSRYDGSIVAADPNPRSYRAEADPVLEGSIAPFTRAFVSYARDELGFKTDLPFELLNGDVSGHWKWREGNSPRGAVGASDALRQALALNPRLHVLIAHGMTDLVTPYMTSRYIAAHLPAGTRGRVELKLYDGGHMMYLRPSSRHRLHEDALQFYEGSPS
jgi:carboxypeptidase C (cathepsin A)